MANVATKGGTLNFVITQPLKKPKDAPVNTPARRAPKSVKPIKRSSSGIEMPDFNNPAAIAPLIAKIDPTDKSIPAVKTTNVIPTEIQMFTEICLKTFHPLSTVKNLSDNKLIKIQSSINAIVDWNLDILEENEEVFM
jgi:hypothetical protein